MNGTYKLSGGWMGEAIEAVLSTPPRREPTSLYARTAREIVPPGKSKKKFKGSKAAKKAGRKRK